MRHTHVPTLILGTAIHHSAQAALKPAADGPGSEPTHVKLWRVRLVFACSTAVDQQACAWGASSGACVTYMQQWPVPAACEPCCSPAGGLTDTHLVCLHRPDAWCIVLAVYMQDQGSRSLPSISCSGGLTCSSAPCTQAMHANSTQRPCDAMTAGRWNCSRPYGVVTDM